MADMDQIWKELTRQEPPQGPSAEGWVYDQLLGAATALDECLNIDPAPPKAYEIYRKDKNAVRNLRIESSHEYKVFSWGLHLNSAIHSTVWACERLLESIAGEELEGKYWKEY